jgi:hypothetical protein
MPRGWHLAPRQFGSVRAQAVSRPTPAAQPEADSKYDDWAVQVHTAPATSAANVWLGYLPEGRNETVARLLDAGKHLSARLNHKSWETDWLHLDIEVLLHE